MQVDKEAEQKQRDRLAAVRDERDDAAVEEALSAVREAAENDENVIPAIVDAVKVYTTMGEIMGVFEDIYGPYRETIGVA
jgi:methylmalonyl-CoA mutase N-terminal domain/subunit